MARSAKTAAQQAALQARDRLRTQQAAQKRRRSNLAVAATVAVVESNAAEQRPGDAMLRRGRPLTARSWVQALNCFTFWRGEREHGSHSGHSFPGSELSPTRGEMGRPQKWRTVTVLAMMRTCLPNGSRSILGAPALTPRWATRFAFDVTGSSTPTSSVSSPLTPSGPRAATLG